MFIFFVIYSYLILSRFSDPEPVHHGVSPSLGNPGVRMKNIECIIKNIKALYEVLGFKLHL